MLRHQEVLERRERLEREILEATGLVRPKPMRRLKRPDPRLKRCSGCGERKLKTTGFSKGVDRDGLSTRCKSCVADYYAKNRDRIRAQQKAYFEDRPGLAVIRKHRMGWDWFQKTVEEQGGVCKICWKVCETNQRLSIDHWHDHCERCNTSRRAYRKGKGGAFYACGPEAIRGLLCARCHGHLTAKEMGYGELNEAEIKYLNAYASRLGYTSWRMLTRARDPAVSGCRSTAL